MVPEDDNWSGNCCIAVRQLLVGKTVTAKLVETQKNSLIHTVDILLSSGMLNSVRMAENNNPILMHVYGFAQVLQNFSF